MTKLDDILQLYSTSKISDHPELTPESVSFMCEKGYLNLTKAELTERELELLQVILGKPIKHYDPWQAFLCGRGKRPVIIRSFFRKRTSSDGQTVSELKVDLATYSYEVKENGQKITF